MSIYTRTGDKGKTSLFGGRRVSKAHPQVHACGAVDELTSSIGLIHAKLNDENLKTSLTAIQRDLHQVMALLAGAKIEISAIEERTAQFEQHIDKLEAQLPKLTRFILPGGTEQAALFHFVRAICRRSEREIVEFFNVTKAESIDGKAQKIVLKYLNRLSDLFFTLARAENKGDDIVT